MIEVTLEDPSCSDLLVPDDGRAAEQGVEDPAPGR
jgi:hypothetical protein